MLFSKVFLQVITVYGQENESCSYGFHSRLQTKPTSGDQNKIETLRMYLMLLMAWSWQQKNLIAEQ